MSSFTDQDGDEFRTVTSSGPRGGLINLVVNGDEAVSFYADDSTQIIRLIQEATK